MDAWGVIEITDDDNNPVERHVVPMLDLDGEMVASIVHDLRPDCWCKPRNIGEPNAGPDCYTGPIWDHNDPEAEGSHERVKRVIEGGGPVAAPTPPPRVN